jgi:hypothetical protein
MTVIFEEIILFSLCWNRVIGATSSLVVLQLLQLMYCWVQPESANSFLHFSLYLWTSFTNTILGNLTIFINHFFYFIVINFIFWDVVFTLHISLINTLSSLRLSPTCLKLKCDVDCRTAICCYLTILIEHVIRVCVPHSAEVWISTDMSFYFARPWELQLSWLWLKKRSFSFNAALFMVNAHVAPCSVELGWTYHVKLV